MGILLAGYLWIHLRNEHILSNVVIVVSPQSVLGFTSFTMIMIKLISALFFIAPEHWLYTKSKLPERSRRVSGSVLSWKLLNIKRNSLKE